MEAGLLVSEDLAYPPCGSDQCAFDIASILLLSVIETSEIHAGGTVPHLLKRLYSPGEAPQFSPRLFLPL